MVASRIRIEVLFRRKKKGMAKVRSFIHHPESFIVTTLVGNNLTNVIFSSFVVLFLDDFLDEFFIILITSFYLLIFGEIIPKAIGQEFSNQLIIVAAQPLKIFKWLFYPINFLLTSVSNFFIRILHLPEEKKIETIFTRTDIRKLLQDSQKDGILPRKEGKLIERIFDLRKTRIRDPMIPRTEIFAADKNISMAELFEKFTQSGYSRIPIYDGNIDNIVGVVHAKDLLGATASIQEIIKEVIFVPETKFAYELLQEFRKKSSSLAIVLDEYGGTEGLITLEDLVEELIGEIYDEFDIDHEKMYRKQNAFTISIDARAEIDEVNERFGLTIPEDESYSTINGFIIKTLQRIPQVGEELDFDFFRIKIENACKKRVVRVRIILKNQTHWKEDF